MKHSENLDQLVPALIKAQAEMGAIVKSEIVSGKKFSYGYATFEDIMEVVKPALETNGLVLSFMPDNLDGKPALTTFIGHISGQFTESTIPLISVSGGSNKAQALGIIFTYTKRYSSGAAFALPIIDDTDGRFDDSDYDDNIEVVDDDDDDVDEKFEQFENQVETTIKKFVNRYELDEEIAFAFLKKTPLSNGETFDDIGEIGAKILIKLAGIVIDNEIERFGLSEADTREPLAPTSKAIVKARDPDDIVRLTDEGLAILDILVEDAENEPEPEPEPAPKKKRGRPRKAKAEESEPIEEPADPDDADAINSFDDIPFAPDEEEE